MVLAPFLIELSVWVIAFGALIFCILCVYIVKALFGVAGGTLGKLPIVGGWINGSLHTVEHKIVSVMSTAAEGAQSLCGAALHAMARTVDWVGREIHAHSSLLGLLATLTLGGVSAAELQALLRGIRALVHANAGTISHVDHRARNVEKRLAHGIGEDVLPRVKGLEREVGHVISRDIPRVWRREAALEREITNLWKWTRTHTLAAGTLAFAGAVALALARLGLGALRCRNVGRAAKQLCGMNPTWLDALLAGTLAIFGPISLVTFAHVMLEAMDEFTAAVQGFIRETHGVPSRSAAQQGFAAPGGDIAFRSASDQGLV